MKKIYADKRSGSSVLSRRLLSVLKAFSSEMRKEEFVRFLLKVRNDLKKHHPLLFQLQNLVDLISLALKKQEDLDRALFAVQQIEEIFERAAKRTSANFFEWINENYNRKVSIATLSYSGTVLECFLTSKDKIKEVYVFSSCPKCEGKIMAEKLRNEGVKVFLVNDFGSAYVLKKVDFVVSGCDAVFSDGSVLNKAGTSVIFNLAKNGGKKTLVLADLSKFVSTAVEREKILRQSLEIIKGYKIKKLNILFDLVEPDLIDYYIADVGFFSNVQDLKKHFDHSRIFNF